jgi:hypothetical protein
MALGGSSWDIMGYNGRQWLEVVKPWAEDGLTGFLSVFLKVL